MAEKMVMQTNLIFLNGDANKYYILPGGTVGYPAHPRLIRLWVCLWVRQIRFNYAAENRLGPTNLVKNSLKNVHWRESRVRYFFWNGFVVMAENRPGPTDLVKYSLNNVNWQESRVRYVWEYLWEYSKSTETWHMGTIRHITQNTTFYLTKQNLLCTLFLQPTRQRV